MATDAGKQRGVVYLVGAGPGDPGLITLRGAECLRVADVVVYDALANPRLLDLAPAAAERVAVGKRHGRRCMSQEAISELLVSRAAAGKSVVRLKGGDPFVFGRGGEEAAALRASGIRFEVVPGVTAGVAAPACVGIPVTHRDFASAVAFVTGHEDRCKAESRLDWLGLARFPGTLVFYMGVTRLAELTRLLIEHGKPADTPAAVIEWGTTPQQRSVTGPLDGVAELVRDIGLRAPAVIVVGPVVSLAGTLCWFEDRPLFGQSVVITRPAHQSAEMFARLTELGAEVLELPALRIEPPADWRDVDGAIDDLDRYGWLVFTSANGVRYFFDRLLATGRDVRAVGAARLAAIGAATARELERFHLRADVIPESANSESLVQAINTRRGVGAARLLLLRADRGREALADGFRDAGVEFDEVAVYRHIDATDWDAAVVERIARGEVDWITLTSPRIVRCLAGHLPEPARQQLRKRIKLASISPLTSFAAREVGFEVAVEAPAADTDAMIRTMVEFVRRSTQPKSDAPL